MHIFSGIVIAHKHAGISETFTVHRVVAGQCVERILPVHSPSIAKIESIPMRAKLYYIRKRISKDAMKVKENTNSDCWCLKPLLSLQPFSSFCLHCVDIFLFCFAKRIGLCPL